MTGIADPPPNGLAKPLGSLTVRDVVSDPSRLMGVKAVWGKSREAVMCFGSRGNAATKDPAHFQQARLTAEKSVARPFLLTIGGGEQVPADLQGRVLELVRVSGAYGETAAFVHDPGLRERLSQWPVAVVLTEVYRIVGDPHLIHDLGFPDRRVLENAYDGVRSNAADIAALWQALKDRPVELRGDVLPPADFREPGKAQLCFSLYPKVSATEGKRRYKLAQDVERSSQVSREAKRLNKERNGGVLVCEACNFADADSRLFDAHHLIPIAVGERETHVGHLAVLCPRCHRWAHAKGPAVYEPLPVTTVRADMARIVFGSKILAPI
ncbi:HNH endonuclease [Phenylobacterium sp.]|uniref:HNH endonuclease n=1 Tax=Phenylobacterium sp. TaxID=1871053 RepID=UPI0035AF6B1E